MLRSVRHCARIFSDIILLNANNKNDTNYSILIDMDFNYEHYMTCSQLNNGVVGSQPLSNSKDVQIVFAAVATSLFQA